MKISFFLIIIGVTVTISGLIFHLQGHGIVGPESSFMYYNPDWITYGQIIAIIGIIIVGAESGLKILKNAKR